MEKSELEKIRQICDENVVLKMRWAELEILALRCASGNISLMSSCSPRHHSERQDELRRIQKEFNTKKEELIRMIAEIKRKDMSSIGLLSPEDLVSRFKI